VLTSGHPTEALVHAPVTTYRKTPRRLRLSCHRRTGVRGQAIILHTITFLRLRTVMASPFASLRRQRGMSPSAVESLLTLMSTM
jgi:hypothetical protein